MRRSRCTAPLTLAAVLTLPVLAGGCYSYNTEVQNTSAQSVQITILKGTRQRAIGSAVLAPGGSVEWHGATNGPVVARVTSEGLVHEVRLPRRSHTEIDVWGAGVGVTIAGVEQIETHDYAETTDTETTDDWQDLDDDGWEAAPAEEAVPPAETELETDDETPNEMIDLIESDA